jgi:methyltransferase-like protein
VDAILNDVPADAGPINAYDAVPYSVCAFPQTRPDRLAATAMLLGMSPAPPNCCRVLELGCASGGNLIPLALAHPNSQFVGIDLSSRQIDEGHRVAAELNLSNLDLRATSILDLDEDIGVFDYVLVHGVYSWVPPAVQARILEICSRQMAPQGVAYISYNAYPGWHARAAMREMLWYHTRGEQDPAARVRAAREFIAFLADSTTGGADSNGHPAVAADGGYGALVQQELDLLRRVPDSYLLHEHLEEFNEPLYFHQFAQRAADHGLQYLAEAQINSMMPGRFGPQIEKTLRRISPDLLQMEQYMDFLCNRMFRQTLLCHANVQLADALRPQAIESLYVASFARPSSANVSFDRDRMEEFRAPGNLSLQTRDPLMKAAMLCLRDNQSVPVPFAELLSFANRLLAEAGVNDAASGDALAVRMLNAFASGVIDLSASPPCYTAMISNKPMASPYARLRAREGGKIVNYRLEIVTLGEPSRLVLGHLDGQHDADALARLVVQWTRSAARADVPSDRTSPAVEKRSAEYVQLFLRAAARHALLHG